MSTKQDVSTDQIISTREAVKKEKKENQKMFSASKSPKHIIEPSVSGYADL